MTILLFYFIYLWPRIIYIYTYFFRKIDTGGKWLDDQNIRPIVPTYYVLSANTQRS